MLQQLSRACKVGFKWFGRSGSHPKHCRNVLEQYVYSKKQKFRFWTDFFAPKSWFWISDPEAFSWALFKELVIRLLIVHVINSLRILKEIWNLNIWPKCWTWIKNLKNYVFPLNFFFNIIYFQSSCGKKEQNRQNRSQMSSSSIFHVYFLLLLHQR